MCLTDLADEVYRDLGEPSDVIIPAIVFWMKNNIGKLNNELLSEFTISDSYVIEPEMSEEAASILKLMYQKSYVMIQFQKNTGASGYISVQQLTEGGRTTKMFNKPDILKLLPYKLKMEDQ